MSPPDLSYLRISPERPHLASPPPRLPTSPTQPLILPQSPPRKFRSVSLTLFIRVLSPHFEGDFEAFITNIEVSTLRAPESRQILSGPGPRRSAPGCPDAAFDAVDQGPNPNLPGAERLFNAAGELVKAAEILDLDDLEPRNQEISLQVR
eukprot:CAMPEP_0184731192 /NCGR_PEP_ID=MMETSP0314-20130426/50133_1 /TAXON_ID=38298 /ORGANISM="Rhodella maculata, Strain CCMP 736" /LENGTH=149 /DNA_ID=CAMNT_0027197523 /DNA_START=113 /DNA_END=560 /DNA_ORIENTATION=-